MWKFIYLLLCTSFVTYVEAKTIVINEFLADLPSGEDEDQDEWVELYNLSDESINLEHYLLVDEKNNELVITSDKIKTNSLVLDPKKHLVVYRRGASFSLNNSTDSIYLFESTNSADPIDSLSYSSTKSNYSIGRYPDGSEDIYEDMISTPGSSNSLPATPTPKPTSSPKATSQSTNSYSPEHIDRKLEKVETEIKSINNTESSDQEQIIGQVLAAVDQIDSSPDITNVASESSHSSFVVGSLTLESEESRGVLQTPKEESQTSKSTNGYVGYYFLVSGLIFALTGGYVWWKRRDDEY